MKNKQRSTLAMIYAICVLFSYSTIKAQTNTEQPLPEINTKFDFVPGDEILFFDDFANDFVGDFPSKWDTNGSGEIVTINDDQKWFELKPGRASLFIPEITDLPEEFTIEYDVMTSGIPDNITHLARVYLMFSDNNKFKSLSNDKDYFFGFPVSKSHAKVVVNNKNGIKNEMDAQIPAVRNGQAHISIAVNMQRLRFWVDDKKYIDIPKFFTEGNKTKYLKFNSKYLKDGRDRIFIKNVKIAKGGVDLRRQLINKGSYSTSNILFDSGSSIIEKQSYGIIKQISQALQQDKNMTLKIVGHTDADGDEGSNLLLSAKRATSIKEALVTIYKISKNRLITEGKGETAPIYSNKTSEGKAKNRRVEFIKQ